MGWRCRNIPTVVAAITSLESTWPEVLSPCRSPAKSSCACMPPLSSRSRNDGPLNSSSSMPASAIHTERSLRSSKGMSADPRPAAMEIRQAARLPQPARIQLAGGDRFVPGGLHEADAAADRRLAEPPEVGLDHDADLGVTARGLCIAHLHDRLSVWWH